MAIKGVNEDREQIKDLSRELQEHHRKLLIGRNAVVKLFDNLDRNLDDTAKLNAVQAFKRVEEKTGREVELRTV